MEAEYKEVLKRQHEYKNLRDFGTLFPDEEEGPVGESKETTAAPNAVAGCQQCEILDASRLLRTTF